MVRIILAFWLILYCAIASADTWPTRQVSIVVAYPPGTTMDSLARVLARHLQAEIGGTFIVENKAGAAGRIGAEYAARAAPDGHTLFISGNSTHSANPSLFKNLGYDPVKDFTQLVRFGTTPYALVVQPKGPTTLAEFLAHAKSVEGKLSYGFGSPAARVATEALASIEQFKAVGVPYRGQPQAITDLMGGQFDFLMADLPVLAPHVKTGKLRALAVFSDKRSPLLPEIPTMGEAGIKGYSLAAWVGLSGPAKMPPEVVTRLSTAAAKILSRPDVADYLLQFGLEYTPNTPREFDQFVRVQLGAWTKYVRAAGIDPE